MNQQPADLESAPPQEILAWAIQTYRPRAAVTSSFGVESAAILHMATRVDPDMPIILLDTGFLFPETHAYARELTRRLGLNLKVYRASAAQIKATRRRLDAGMEPGGSCCETTKVSLMRRALEGLDCWIAGLRRDQSGSRKRTPVVQTLDSGLVKVHPLATWTAERVRAYMVEHTLPIHPLWFRGYTSVGCWPCTTPPLHQGDLRSGRWPGTEKTECGIHVMAHGDLAGN